MDFGTRTGNTGYKMSQWCFSNCLDELNGLFMLASFWGYKKMTINLVEAEMEQKSLTGQPVLPELLSDMRVEEKKVYLEGELIL